MRFYVCFTTLFVAVLTQDIPSRRRKTWDTSEDETSPLPPPKFGKTPDRVTVREGNMAKLECSVENIGTKQVVWRRKSESNPLTVGRRTFVDDERVSVQHVPLTPDWVLIIKQVRFDDAGEYECQISSVDRQLRKPVYLTVTAGRKPPKPKPEIKITGTTYVDQGDRIRLICNATGGVQSDEIDWFRNGQKLTSDNKKVFIHKRVSLMEKKIDSILEIEDADMDDAGTYVCRTSGLLIDSKRVEVLNGTHFSDTINKKRGTGKDSVSDGNPGSKQESLKTDRNIAVNNHLHVRYFFLVFVITLILPRLLHNNRLPT